MFEHKKVLRGHRSIAEKTKETNNAEGNNEEALGQKKKRK